MARVSLADGAVALTGYVFQSHLVEDDDVTSPISYQAVRLEPVRNERHAGPAHTKHLCKGLLCQREFALIYQVERLKQPAREAVCQRVQSIAGSGLLDLTERSLLKFQDEVSDALTLTDRCAKI